MELRIYPASKMALLDARVVALAWGCMVLTAVLWIVSRFFDLSVATPLLLMSVGVFFVAAIAHVVLSFRHTCPVCSKHPTIEGFGPIDEDSRSQAKFVGWSGVVLNILKRRQLVCIHCGTRFVVDA